MQRTLVFVFVFISFLGNSQTGGQHAYQFLNSVSTARVAALGGNLIAVKDKDVDLGFYNPSLLNKEMGGQLSFTFVNYFANSNFTYAGYAHHIDDLGTFAVTIQHLSYGKFKETNNIGNVIGEFKASETNITFGYGREVSEVFSVGANLKTIFSSLERYSSFGMAIDVAGTYHNKETGFSAAGVIKNTGYQFSTYYDNAERNGLPFEVQLALAYKLKHAPIRFSVAGENLQTWDLTYADPNAQTVLDPLTGEKVTPEKPSFGDKLMRHVVVGAEILITEHFNIRLGFNYKRRQELKVAVRPGMGGMSLGFGMRVKNLHLSYGFAAYSRAVSSHHFTITTNLHSFKRKITTTPVE